MVHTSGPVSEKSQLFIPEVVGGGEKRQICVRVRLFEDDSLCVTLTQTSSFI